MGLLDRFTKKSTAKFTAAKPAAVVKKSEVKSETAVVAPAKLGAGKLAYKVIIKPLVTEKCAVLQSQNKYGFAVAAWATKQQISAAVKELYAVDALAVHVINVQGRQVRFGRNLGRRSDYKKALVTLKPGQSITIHEGV